LIVLAILVPTFSAFLGFIIGVVGAAIYNLVAKWLGGLQVEVEEEFDPGVISAMRERMRKARAKSAAKAMRGWIALQTASRKMHRDCFVSRKLLKCGLRAAFLFRALAVILFSLSASAQRNHGRRKAGPIH